tara:strand:+ start:657 stop:1286 length:630 start_codon:yes stop_codon:yes gene_type:complete
MDVRGDRFLNRFAGSDDFQNRLNRSKSEPRDYRSSNTPGDFSRQSSSSSDSRMGPGATTAQTTMDSDYGAPNYGPNFEKQVQREKTIQSDDTVKSSQASSDIFNKYANANRFAQSGRSDGSNIANKYINNAAASNPLDIVALDKHIRKGPLYHEAKSEVAGLQTYGDKYRNARENSVNWNQATPMEGTESPDFEGIYDKTKKDIDSIKV